MPSNYKLHGADANVVSNLRYEYKDTDGLKGYTDEEIAQAWREFSISDEYELHKDRPELFREWCEMAQGGELNY